ncbi:MAG: hypothetical protein J6X33_01460 [Clostridiales bacterium]|nr:hypothetical protein [Clostridiales bacterium]
MRNKIISILFCLILAAGVIAHFAFPDKQYSENEKRTLKQFPSVSWNAIRTGKFGDDMEEYLEDQYPGRDAWVAAKTIAERASGKQESGGVYFANDGYIMEIQKGFPEDTVVTNLTAIQNLSAALAKDNISVKLMLVPTAPYILKDKLPAFAPNANQHAVIEYAANYRIDQIDVTDALTQHKDEYIFYKTDHHWTSLGAYYAYAAWRDQRGTPADDLSSWTKETLCNDFRGTTYAKVNYPFAPFDTIDAYYKKANRKVDYNEGDYITDSIYERKYLDGSDQYATFFNSNQSTTVAQGDGEGRLLILKDSYANSFAQFVVDDYEETHMIDMRFYKQSVYTYIKEHGITEVLIMYNIPNFSIDKDLGRCDK